MKATLTVLGSGTSMGVPTIGCDCAVCTSADPHDRRTRPSIMVQWDESTAADAVRRTVLIDTTPDFREQVIREHVRKIDAIIYTHGHADHILGLDDVRPLSFPRVTGGTKIPLYASDNTARVLRNVFRYIFEADYKYGGLAQVEINPVNGPPRYFWSDIYAHAGIARRCSYRSFSLWQRGVSHRLQRSAGRVDGAAGRAGHSVSGCAAASSAPHALDGGELTEDCGAAEAPASFSRTFRTTCRMRRRMPRCQTMCVWRTTV